MNMEQTEKQALRNLFARIALSQVGVKESGGNNLGDKIVEYQKTTWLPPGHWPWCAAFMAWCLKEWLNDPYVINWMFPKPKNDGLGKPQALRAEEWRCKDSRAFGWEEWAKKKGLLILPETERALTGDIVIYDFSHIGIVVEDQKWYSKNIVAVEGNSSDYERRDGSSGDGVFVKKRHQKLVKSYIRIIV